MTQNPAAEPGKGFSRYSAARAAAKKSDIKAGDVSRLLYMRPDGIGDAVISNLLLEHLSAAFPQADIVVACDAPLVSLFAAVPGVAEVLSLRKNELRDNAYAAHAVRYLRSCGAQIVFNGVLSPTREAAKLTFALDMPVISTAVNSANMPPVERDDFEERVDALIPVRPGPAMDIERYANMLRHFGFADVRPRAVLHISPGDDALAGRLWEEFGFTPENTVALFPGGGIRGKEWLGYGAALAEICVHRGFNVAAMGGGKDFSLAEINLEPLRQRGIPVANLCSDGTLMRNAAFLRDCRLAVGADTGLAHMACAFDLPLVALVPGAHFGRFLPYHARTTAVCLPLDCYGCNWPCRYGRVHCIAGIAPATVSQAVEFALNEDRQDERRTLFMQPPASWPAKTGYPAWQSPGEFIIACREQAKAHGNPLKVVLAR